MCGSNTMFVQVTEEQQQRVATRRTLYEHLEQAFQRPIISYFTSFIYDVIIDDGDATMLEDVLRPMDLSRGIAVLINSPGGDALAAERIIRILREYSGTDEFQVIVAGKAKSAATMICLGASKIYMDNTAELGSVDPQLISLKGGIRKIYSVYNLIKSYEKLFRGAVQTKGNLEPYLQQLSNYDARNIEEYRKILDLANDISIKALKSGMLSKMSVKSIRDKIKVFLTPEKVKAHGRAIYAEEAKGCNLNIETKDLKDDTWSKVYELYFRLNNLLTTTQTAKIIESKDSSFSSVGDSQ